MSVLGLGPTVSSVGKMRAHAGKGAGFDGPWANARGSELPG